MVNFINLMKIILMNDRAVTSIEYAIIAGLIALVIVAALGSLKDQVLLLYNRIVSAFPT